MVKTFTYKNSFGIFRLDFVNTRMDKHIERMLADGWQLLNSADDPGHVKVGTTVGLAAMTGGLSLLFGASRTKQKITVTFMKPDPPAPPAKPREQPSGNAKRSWWT